MPAHHFSPTSFYFCIVARILGIDYGAKRTGLAVTDPLQIIVSGLDTVATSTLLEYLKTYLHQEEVEAIVIGEPLHKDGNPTQLHASIVELSKKLKKLFPEVEVVLHDEYYSSARAKEIIFQSGAKKKKRRDKGLVDKVAAGLILQDYLDTKRLD